MTRPKKVEVEFRFFGGRWDWLKKLSPAMRENIDHLFRYRTHEVMGFGLILQSNEKDCTRIEYIGDWNSRQWRERAAALIESVLNDPKLHRKMLQRVRGRHE